MKTLFLLLKRHIVEDFKYSTYIYSAIIVGLLVFVNYKFNFEIEILNPHRNSFKGAVLFSLVNIISYYIIIVPILIINRKGNVLQQVKFWVVSLLILIFLGIDRGTSLYKIYTIDLPFYERFYLNRIFMHLEGVYVYLIPFILVLIFYRGENKLGLSFKNSKSKVFILMIAFVIPLIVWASFQEDFLRTYPRLKYWQIPELFGMKKWLMEAVFIISYAFDFVIVEMVFRGAMVILMASFIGKDSILPMAVVYVVLHFGKPMAEAISSFFGGYILGVFALNLRSIWGGVIVHLGLAMLMELGAIVQNVLKD